MQIVVIGRYPPPFDGQTIATARLTEILSSRADVEHFDIQPPASSTRHQAGVTVRRSLHFLVLRHILREKLNDIDSNVALWPAVSPDPAGHARDLLAVLPELDRFNRTIAIVHRGNFDKLFRSILTRYTASRVVERVSLFVFLTHELAERCAKWIPAPKRAVIPNTIDSAVLFSTEEVAALESERLKDGVFTILFASNMIPAKGYLELVEAVHYLQEHGKDVGIRLAGAWRSNQEKSEFERAAGKLRPGSVEHLGPVKERGRMKDLYRKAHALALPTYYENEAQPLTILEALNAGLPVISTRHAGIPEMVESGVEGYLIPKRDPHALVHAVDLMLSAPTWLELSRAARSRFVRDFAPDVFLREWLVQLGSDTSHGSKSS